MPSRRATDSVTGVIRSTVVTLSRNADSPAVTTHRMRSRRSGSPCDIRTEWTASHWKKPVRASALARIIIPASRKMTLKSMAANASSWSMTPRTMSSSPPSSGDQGAVEALRRDERVGDQEDAARDPGVHQRPTPGATRRRGSGRSGCSRLFTGGLIPGRHHR